MSVKVMGMVWDADLPQAEKFVLLALADHADHDGGSIHPGRELIARKTGYHPIAISKIVARLVDKGIVSRERCGHRGATSLYRINIDALIGLSGKDSYKATLPPDRKVSPEATLFDEERVALDTRKGSPRAQKKRTYIELTVMNRHKGNSPPAGAGKAPRRSSPAQPVLDAPSEPEKPTAKHPAIQAVREIIHRYPNKALYGPIVEALGVDFDVGRLRECGTAWLARGFNPTNLAWLFEWYFTGIPDGQSKVQSANERNFAGCLKLIAG